MVIPGQVTEIRYNRTGAMRGRYYHKFKPGVRMIANADGSVTLRGRRRIHERDDAPGFWDKYGGRENPRKHYRDELPRSFGDTTAHRGYLIIRHGFGRPGYWIEKDRRVIQHHVASVDEGKRVIDMLVNPRRRRRRNAGRVIHVCANPSRARRAASRGREEFDQFPWLWLGIGFLIWGLARNGGLGSLGSGGLSWGSTGGDGGATVNV